MQHNRFALENGVSAQYIRIPFQIELMHVFEPSMTDILIYNYKKLRYSLSPRQFPDTLTSFIRAVHLDFSISTVAENRGERKRKTQRKIRTLPNPKQQIQASISLHLNLSRARNLFFDPSRQHINSRNQLHFFFPVTTQLKTFFSSCKNCINFIIPFNSSTAGARMITMRLLVLFLKRGNLL